MFDIGMIHKQKAYIFLVGAYLINCCLRRMSSLLSKCFSNTRGGHWLNNRSTSSLQERGLETSDYFLVAVAHDH
jgi:hypothetical protein